jgi:hypothetical protein
MIPADNVFSFQSQPTADRTIHEMNKVDFNADFPDAELPDDLAMLAEQLGDDADMLGELYPARVPQFLPSVSSLTNGIAGSGNTDDQDSLLRPMPVWMRWSAAAAVLVCALWGTMAVDDQPINIEFGPPRGKVVDSGPRVTGATRTSVQPAPVTGEIYENLTAPAREALLDMWEAESLPQASLSI